MFFKFLGRLLKKSRSIKTNRWDDSSSLSTLLDINKGVFSVQGSVKPNNLLNLFFIRPCKQCMAGITAPSPNPLGLEMGYNVSAKELCRRVSLSYPFRRACNVFHLLMHAQWQWNTNLFHFHSIFNSVSFDTKVHSFLKQCCARSLFYENKVLHLISAEEGFVKVHTLFS